MRASVSGIHGAREPWRLIVADSFVRIKHIAPVCHIIEMYQYIEVSIDPAKRHLSIEAMPPRKAGKPTVATPARSSVRLKGKKQGDPARPAEARDTSPVESRSNPRRRKQDGSAYVEGVKNAPQESDPRPRRRRREDPSYVEDQVATASGASLEKEDIAATTVVTGSIFGHGRPSRAEAGEREIFDPAW